MTIYMSRTGSPEQGQVKPQRGGGRDGFFSPSYIIVFDEKGKLQYTLGPQGSTDVPFYYIEKPLRGFTGKALCGFPFLRYMECLPFREEET